MSDDSLITEGLYTDYLTSLLKGDRSGCTQIVKHLSHDEPFLKDLYLNLFQRSLYEVGDLWEKHRVSVSTEHLATAITERLMSVVQPEVFSGAERRRSVIVSCVAEEYHQLGARMVADLAELHGWRGYFLGANTPIAALIKMIDEIHPDMVGLSLSIYFNLPALEKALDAIMTTFPGLPIVLGGQVFRQASVAARLEDKYSGVMVAADIDSLERVLSEHE